MYRFLLSPRWIAFHLLVVVGVVVMVNLAFWQLRRLDERREFNARIEARFDAEPVDIDTLLSSAGTDLDSVEWRPVEVGGEFTGGGDVRIVNRSQHGRAGDNVVSPFRLADGRIVLVNRGFVPLGTPDIPPPPTVEITLVGRVHPSDERRRGQLSDPADGVLTEAQRIDLDRLAPQLPDGELIPLYVDLIEPAPGDLPEPVAAPELTERNHLSYAGQWLIFATLAVVGWVLAVRKSVNARRRAATQSPKPDPVPIER